MAKEYHVKIPAHQSIYDPQPRELDIWFCEPEHGINNKTGLLLAIAGFGSNAASSSFTELRNVAADKYNLTTVQCNYFGSGNMHNNHKVNLDINFDYLKNIISENDFAQIVSAGRVPDINRLCEEYELNLEGTTPNEETLADFNDMGLMQALDNIFSILAVKAIIEDNGYTFNHRKIIVYGESHGAYLSYLCNAFSPGLFSHIIDNSAWLYPEYFADRRYFHQMVYGKSTITMYTDHLASTLPQDEELQRLPSLYKKFDNKSDILSIHGTSDKISSYMDKIDFCRSISHSKYKIISPAEVDGKVFKSSGHCFNSNSNNIFDYVMKNYHLNSNNSNSLDLPSVKYETSSYTYFFDYSSGVPVLNRLKK